MSPDDFTRDRVSDETCVTLTAPVAATFHYLLGEPFTARVHSVSLVYRRSDGGPWELSRAVLRSATRYREFQPFEVDAGQRFTPPWLPELVAAHLPGGDR